MAVHELPVIRLKEKSFIEKQGITQNTLDLISSTLLEPTTLIKKGPKEAISKVRERRLEIARTKDIGKALDVAGETVMATGLGIGAALGAGYPAAAGRALLTVAPTTPKGILLATTGAGILTTSRTARKYAGQVLQDPTKAGREAGLLIDKAAEKKGLPNLSEALKTAGLVGAGVVGTTAAIKGAKTLKERFLGSRVTADKLADVMPTTPAPIFESSSVPTALTGTSSSEPVIARKEEKASPPISPPPVNVKVINKPQVNVAVAQSL